MDESLRRLLLPLVGAGKVVTMLLRRLMVRGVATRCAEDALGLAVRLGEFVALSRGVKMSGVLRPDIGVAVGEAAIDEEDALGSARLSIRVLGNLGMELPML